MRPENTIFLDKITHEFVKKKILVIGDLMVDEYITGKVSRISPEAPIPVLDFKEKRLEAGGASNVAHNIKSLGATVSIAGVAAEDEAGMWLRKHFMDVGIATDGILSEEGKPTTIKTRYATRGQQLLRIDYEKADGINEQTQAKIYQYLKKVIGGLDAVVMSDYKKGVLQNGDFVQRIVSLCNKHHVLVSIDSKSRHIKDFKNIDFVKPNNIELEEAVGIRIEDEEGLEAAGRAYLSQSGAKALVVTRGGKGISVFVPERDRCDYPAEDVQVYDVCGAGDTVLSTISLSMVSGIPIGEAARLANLAAGIVINKIGTVAVTAEELMRSVNEE